MPLTLDGTNGVSAVQAGAVESGDLASGAIGIGDLPAGSVVQVVSQRNSSDLTTTSTSPQTVVSASITPTLSSNKILIYAVVGEPDQGDGRIASDVFRDTTSTKIFEVSSEVGRGLTTGTERHLPSMVSFGIDSPNTTSSITYLLTANSNTGSAIRVGNGADHVITLMEIAG